MLILKKLKLKIILSTLKSKIGLKKRIDKNPHLKLKIESKNKIISSKLKSLLTNIKSENKTTKAISSDRAEKNICIFLILSKDIKLKNK